MSKYTEAKQYFKSEDNISPKGQIMNPYKGAHYWIIVDEALEIADRLEKVGKLGVVCFPQKYGSKTEAFADGYKQALADIRGDNNG